MAKLVWRVKLVSGVAGRGDDGGRGRKRIERDEQAGLSDLGLRLAEAKQRTSALQAEIVPAQVEIIAVSIAAPARLVGVGWPARDITSRRSARCSATSQFGSGACLSVPASGRAKQRASPPSSSRPQPWRPNWPM